MSKVVVWFAGALLACGKSSEPNAPAEAAAEPAAAIPMPDNATITVDMANEKLSGDAQQQLAHEAANVWNYCRDASIDGDRFHDVWHTASFKIGRKGDAFEITATFDDRRRSVHKGATASYETDLQLMKIRPLDENSRRLCALASTGWNEIRWKTPPPAVTLAPPLDAASAPAEQAIQGDAVKVTAEALMSDYQLNDISADDKYRNRTLLVTGKIASVGKDFLGIGDDDPTMVVLRTSKGDVGARLGDARAATELKQGQVVTLRCIGKGWLPELKSPFVESCVIGK